MLPKCLLELHIKSFPMQGRSAPHKVGKVFGTISILLKVNNLLGFVIHVKFLLLIRISFICPLTKLISIVLNSLAWLNWNARYENWYGWKFSLTCPEIWTPFSGVTFGHWLEITSNDWSRASSVMVQVVVVNAKPLTFAF